MGLLTQVVKNSMSLVDYQLKYKASYLYEISEKSLILYHICKKYNCPDFTAYIKHSGYIINIYPSNSYINIEIFPGLSLEMSSKEFKRKALKVVEKLRIKNIEEFLIEEPEIGYKFTFGKTDISFK